MRLVATRVMSLPGRLIWARDVVEDNGARNPGWGKSCSPLVMGHLVVVSAGWLLFKGNYSRVFLATFWFTSTVYLLVLRVGFRELIRALRRRGWTSRNALVVGTDELARHIQEKFSKNFTWKIENSASPKPQRHSVSRGKICRQ